MVAVIHGSSFFRPIGNEAHPGPTGSTGPTGPTGPYGTGGTGATGYSGGNITEMYFVGPEGLQQWTGDKLRTIFTWADGSTSEYTTETKVQGPTGNNYILIDGGNTYGMSIPRGGLTLFNGRDLGDTVNVIELRSIEATGDSLTLVQSDEPGTDPGTFNIHFDRGNFGYIDTEENTNYGQGLVGTDGSSHPGPYPVGLAGASYDSELNAINVKVKNFKEQVKYMTFGEGGDFVNIATEDGQYPKYEGVINPNSAKIFVTDMRSIDPSVTTGYEVVNDVSYPQGATGGLNVIFSGATFGYTGNTPTDMTAYEKTLSKAFTLIVHGASMGDPATDQVRFENCIWPLDLQPCWSQGTDIFNFFWMPCQPRSSDPDQPEVIDICPNGVAWYGNLVQWKEEGHEIIRDGTWPNDPFFCHNLVPDGRNYAGSNVDIPGGHKVGRFGLVGATGACCIGDGNCVHVAESLCDGYFMGAGTTCGGDPKQLGKGGACITESGACCLHYVDIGNIDCNIRTIDECINLGSLYDVVTVFGGTGSDCEDVDCDRASKSLGACCDGIGNCEQITKEECSREGKYFLGVGVPCTRVYGNDIVSLCSGGTGACCQGDGTCEDGVTGESCLNDNKTYAGDKTKCESISCENETVGHASRVLGLNLRPGEMFAGGMVVGIYQPFGSACHGASAFGGSKNTPWSDLMAGGSTGATVDWYGMGVNRYLSKYDYNGYGFDSIKGCSEFNNIDIHSNIVKPDSYYIIASLEPIAITGDREVTSLLEHPGATSEFYWGNKGSAWGPLYNQNTELIDDLSDAYVRRTFPMREGYWYNQRLGKASYDNIAVNTFTPCRVARVNGLGHTEKLLTKKYQSAHGLWHRNWGLYNTIRIISADNVLFKGYNEPSFTHEQFGPGLTADYISAFRAVRLKGDVQYDVDDGEMSGWYLPSHDELSYIASHCINDNDTFNINSELFQAGGVPFKGWHWTSTGAFDESKGISAGVGEGIINPITPDIGVTADAGSLAWAMHFDVNGDSDKFFVGKKHRTHNTYKVRPIRMVRCDGLTAAGGAENQKLWKLPRVLRDSDKDINQD